MAAIGRDVGVEAALLAIDGVERVEAAIASAGLPGVRAARVAVVLRDAAAAPGVPPLDPGRHDGADALGAVVRAALDALRVAHGPTITGSIAIERQRHGVRVPVPADRLIAAAGLVDAGAAGGELLFGGDTRAEPQP